MDLPDDVLLRLCNTYLSYADIISLLSTCRRLRALLLDPANKKSRVGVACMLARGPGVRVRLSVEDRCGLPPCITQVVALPGVCAVPELRTMPAPRLVNFVKSLMAPGTVVSKNAQRRLIDYSPGLNKAFAMFGKRPPKRFVWKRSTVAADMLGLPCQTAKCLGCDPLDAYNVDDPNLVGICRECPYWGAHNLLEIFSMRAILEYLLGDPETALGNLVAILEDDDNNIDMWGADVPSFLKEPLLAHAQRWKWVTDPKLVCHALEAGGSTTVDLFAYIAAHGKITSRSSRFSAANIKLCLLRHLRAGNTEIIRRTWPATHFAIGDNLLASLVREFPQHLHLIAWMYYSTANKGSEKDPKALRQLSVADHLAIAIPRGKMDLVSPVIMYPGDIPAETRAEDLCGVLPFCDISCVRLMVKGKTVADLHAMQLPYDVLAKANPVITHTGCIPEGAEPGSLSDIASFCSLECLLKLVQCFDPESIPLLLSTEPKHFPRYRISLPFPVHCANFDAVIQRPPCGWLVHMSAESLCKCLKRYPDMAKELGAVTQGPPGPWIQYAMDPADIARRILHGSEWALQALRHLPMSMVDTILDNTPDACARNIVISNVTYAQAIQSAYFFKLEGVLKPPDVKSYKRWLKMPPLLQRQRLNKHLIKDILVKSTNTTNIGAYFKPY